MEKEYKLTEKQLECINFAEEAYKLYNETFDKYTNKKRNELLEVGLDIIKDGFGIDEASALIIQQIIHFKLTLKSVMAWIISPEINKLLDDELHFIIKLVLYKHEIENDNYSDS